MAHGWLSYAFEEAILVNHRTRLRRASRRARLAGVGASTNSQAGDGTWCAVRVIATPSEPAGGAELELLQWPLVSVQYDYRAPPYEYAEEIDRHERLFQPDDCTSTAHASFVDYDADGDDDLVTDGPKLWQKHGDGASSM